MSPATPSRLSAALRSVGLFAGFVLISVLFRHHYYDQQLPNQQDTINYYRTVYQAAQAIHGHDYFPRVSAIDADGRGYPYLQFYPPLGFLVPAYVSVLGHLDAQMATNLSVALAYAAAGFAFLAFGRRLGLSRWAAVIGAVSLLTYPYVTHLSFMNLPMFFGLCATTCVLASLAWCLQEPGPGSIASLYAATVALGMTHLLSVLLAVPALVVLAPAIAWSKGATPGEVVRRSAFAAGVVLLGLGSCAFQLGPALIYGHEGILRISSLLTHPADVALFASHHTLLRDLFNPWIAGPTLIEGTQLTQHQFRIGLPYAVGLLAILYGLITGKSRSPTVAACLALVLGALVLTMPAVLRHAPSAIAVFQFSSRFLAIIAIPGAFLVGLAASGLRRAGSHWVALLCVVATSALCVQHFVSADNEPLTGLSNPVRLPELLKNPRSTYSEDYLVEGTRFASEFPDQPFLGGAQYAMSGDRQRVERGVVYTFPALPAIPPGARLVGYGDLPDGLEAPQSLSIRLGSRWLGPVAIHGRTFAFSLPIPTDLGPVSSIAYDAPKSVDVDGHPMLARLRQISIEGLPAERTVVYWGGTSMTVSRSKATMTAVVSDVADDRIHVVPVLAYPGLQRATVNGVPADPILVPDNDRIFLGFHLPRGPRAEIVVTFTGSRACNALSWICLAGAAALVTWTRRRPLSPALKSETIPAPSADLGLLSNEGFVLSVLFAVVSAFYVWTAVSADYSSLVEVQGMPFTHQSPEYYPLLAKGFLHGQLNLYKTPDPKLLALDDPWDPVKAGKDRVPDITFYKGKFYLYFGPTPVLLLFLPCRLLTNLYPSHAFAVAYFSIIGLGINFLLLRSIRRRYFPGVSAGWLFCGALALSFATTVPQLLRRPDVWEVAIASGYCTVSLALAATYFALTRRSGLWLAVASLAFGLAAGSRPTLIIGAVALLPVLLWLFRVRPPTESAGRFLIRKLLPAALPCALCVAGLLTYNALRFGSPFEFGQRYQMHARDERGTPALSLRFIPFNAHVYFASPPNLTLEFPYVHPITIPQAPAGQLGFEDVYGLVPTMPILLAGLGAFALATASWRRRAGDLAAFALATGIVSASGAAFILVFAGACNRYQVDFAPSLAILASLGLFVVAEKGGPARWLRPVLVAATAWTVIMSVAISLAHKGLLQRGGPATWSALARFGNAPQFALDRIEGSRRGTVSIPISFPGKSEGSEVLFKSGKGDEADTLFVDYFPDRRLRFRLDHAGFGGPQTAIVPVAAGMHTLVLELGCLYADYAVQFSTTPGAALDAVTMRFGVWLDGETLANRRAAYFPVPEVEQHWGFMAPYTFTGEAPSIDWVDQRPSTEPLRTAGPVTLDVTFPDHRVGAQDPILSTGAVGRADVLYVRYLDASHVQFGYDHWGKAEQKWPAIEILPGVAHQLVVEMGTATGAADDHTLRIDMDGKPLVEADVALYKVAPQDVYIGYTPYMSSSCGLEFSGKLREVPATGSAVGP